MPLSTQRSTSTCPKETGRVRSPRVPKRTARFIRRAYDVLFAHFGPQHWWPGDTPFEIAVGAILTQNTNWQNVERAIANVKRARRLGPRKLLALPDGEVARLIRPAGYFNVKARRLRAFLEFLEREYRSSMKRFAADERPDKRDRLLVVNGVGPETADSILLYALGEPTFVVDAYTRRILSRHGIVDARASYDEIKDLFERVLERDVALFNEYHALVVMCGKHYCRPSPNCAECPLRVSRW